VSMLAGESSRLGRAAGFRPQIPRPGRSIPPREQAAAAGHFCVDFVLASVAGRFPIRWKPNFVSLLPPVLHSFSQVNLALRALPVWSVFTRRAAPTFPSGFHRQGIVFLVNFFSSLLEPVVALRLRAAAQIERDSLSLECSHRWSLLVS
jgi:hypothetical protein